MHLLFFFYFLLTLAFGLPTDSGVDGLIPNSYIVVLHPIVSPASFLDNLLISVLGTLAGGFKQTHTYQWQNFSGFAANMQQAAVDQLMLRSEVSCLWPYLQL